MTIRTLAAAAGFALAAEAFIIPSTISLPGVEVDEEGAFRALRMPDGLPEQLKKLQAGVVALSQEDYALGVRLNCFDCSFTAPGATEEENAEASRYNAIMLEFAISSDRKSLVLNGAPIYPFSDHTEATARQNVLLVDRSEAVSIGHQEELTSEERPLQYAAGTREMAAADGTDAQLIDMFFAINGLGGEPVTVDNVDIRMLADEDHNLHLVHVIQAPSPDAPPNGRTEEGEHHHQPRPHHDCSADEGLSMVAGMMCRLRAKIAHKMHHLHLLQPNRGHSRKPCPGRMMQRPELSSEADTPFFIWGAQGEGEIMPPFTRGGPHKFMPHAHHPHHDHHRHHGHRHGMIHMFASALRGFVFGFVIPVLIGVIAGMTASIIGMLVGTAIAWLWVKLVRGGKRGNASARQEARAAMCDDEEEIFVGEKDGLMLEHAPAYEEVAEAAPAYVEKE